MLFDSIRKVKSFFFCLLYGDIQAKRQASCRNKDKLTIRGRYQPFSYIIVCREISFPSRFTFSRHLQRYLELVIIFAQQAVLMATICIPIMKVTFLGAMNDRC